MNENIEISMLIVMYSFLLVAGAQFLMFMLKKYWVSNRNAEVTLLYIFQKPPSVRCENGPSTQERPFLHCRVSKNFSFQPILSIPIQCKNLNKTGLAYRWWRPGSAKWPFVYSLACLWACFYSTSMLRRISGQTNIFCSSIKMGGEGVSIFQWRPARRKSQSQ